MFDASQLSMKCVHNLQQEDLKKFKCGNSSIDSFIQNESYFRHIERSVSTTVVTYHDEIVACFTLKRIPLRYKPDEEEERDDALDITYLAVARDYQGMGIGTYLLDYIANIAYMVNERFLTLDALYEVWEWYANRGFQYLIEDDINLDKTSGHVYMAIDIYDKKLVEEYLRVE